MNRVKLFMRKYWFYVVALILPWMIVGLFCMVKYAMGKPVQGILTGDLAVQIVPFAYELWNKIHAGEGLSYTWHIAGGCDFNSALGYLMSPFTLIMLLLPKDWIPNYMQFTMIMKWSLTAWSMVYFFYHTKHNTLKSHKKLVSLFLGLAFALSNGIISYIVYIQFMDALICFPLLLLLLEQMVDNKSWKRYYLLLAFTIFSNSYITFQICLFLIFWFFLQYNKKTQEKWKKFFIFAGSSLLATLTTIGGILAGLLLARGRLSEGSNDNKISYMKSFLIPVKDFVKQFFMLGGLANTQEINPNVYCSVIIALLILFFIFIKIGKKRKLYMSAGVIFLLASFFIGGLNLLWHLFNVPNGVYNRFMYLFTFAMLLLALYVLVHFQEIRLHHIIFVGIGCSIIGVTTFLALDNYSEPYIYLVTALVFVLYILILILYAKGSIKYVNLLVTISVIGILELSVNAGAVFQSYDGADYYGKEGTFIEAADLLEDADIETGERISVANPTTDLGMVANKNSESVFISSINVDLKYLYAKLGMGNNSSVEYMLRGASPLLNLMFNVRYGVDIDEKSFSDVEKVKSSDNYNLYRMKRLAGLGYMVNAEVQNWNLDGMNCFQAQNDFVNKAVCGEDIFEPVKAEITCQDIQGNMLEADDEYEANGSYLYHIPNNWGNENDAVQMNAIIEEDIDLYVYTWSKSNYKLVILIDGNEVSVGERSFIQQTIHVGKVKKGQCVTIVAVPYLAHEKGEESSLMFMFGGFNEEAYATAYEKLSSNVYEIETEESDYIKGTIQVDEAGIMMTSIQAVEGFTVYVDGKETEYKTIGGALMGVPLDVGTHTVEFKYETPFKNMKRLLTLTGLSIFALICIYDESKKRKKICKKVEA